MESENTIFPGFKISKAPESAIDFIPDPPALWPYNVILREDISSMETLNDLRISNVLDIHASNSPDFRNGPVPFLEVFVLV